MIRRFFRHLWESLKSLKRNGWMTVAAVSSITITLILVGLFASVILNTTKLATDIENNVRVMTYLDTDSQDNDKTIVQDGKTVDNNDYHKIYNNIAKLDHVKKITFSSKDQQLKKLTKTMGSTWKLFEGDANPLYDVYIVDTTSPKYVKSVSKELKKMEGVTKATYGGVNTDKVFKLASFIRTWGLVGTIILLIIAIFLISNTIRITILSRSREIQIMRLVGAKNGYIRWPFFLEGAWVGLLGSIIPSLLVTYVYKVAFKAFENQLLSQNLSMLMPSTFIPLMVTALFIIGILIGAVGSIISMRRFLKI